VVEVGRRTNASLHRIAAAFGSGGLNAPMAAAAGEHCRSAALLLQKRYRLLFPAPVECPSRFRLPHQQEHPCRSCCVSSVPR
jgi:hypothetical protein